MIRVENESSYGSKTTVLISDSWKATAWCKWQEAIGRQWKKKKKDLTETRSSKKPQDNNNTKLKKKAMTIV